MTEHEQRQESSFTVVSAKVSLPFASLLKDKADQLGISPSELIRTLLERELMSESLLPLSQQEMQALNIIIGLSNQREIFQSRVLDGIKSAQSNVDSFDKVLKKLASRWDVDKLVERLVLSQESVQRD